MFYNNFQLSNNKKCVRLCVCVYLLIDDGDKKMFNG